MSVAKCEHEKCLYQRSSAPVPFLSSTPPANTHLPPFTCQLSLSCLLPLCRLLPPHLAHRALSPPRAYPPLPTKYIEALPPEQQGRASRQLPCRAPVPQAPGGRVSLCRHHCALLGREAWRGGDTLMCMAEWESVLGQAHRVLKLFSPADPPQGLRWCPPRQPLERPAAGTAAPQAPQHPHLWNKGK